MQDNSVPTHIGYIVDGNRRWAKKHGLPTYEGHLAGYNALKEILIDTHSRGVKYVSIYMFSTENWKRSSEEISNIMKLVLRLFTTDIGEVIEKGIRIRILGIDMNLSQQLIDAAKQAEEKTAHLTEGTLCICFNYGGQREIADAAKKCVEDGLKPEEITEEAIAERLYAPDVPPIDIVVRTSGEQRLSNFMLWRSAYSELMFIDKLWPDMKKDDVAAIIEEYHHRQRRFGE